MQKIRYYKLRISKESNLDSIKIAALKLGPENGISVMESIAGNLVLKCTLTKHIETTQILSDGSEVKSKIPTMEQYVLRFFAAGSGLMLSLLDPPRGSRVTAEVLSKLLGKDGYYIEPLEINKKMISWHIEKFDYAKLVSAKIRDFKVYENAVGRLEISSKDGLIDEIAPFLSGKYHKLDSLTYEVTHKFERGLIYYFSNGAVKISGPLVESAFSIFEKQL